MEDAVVRMILNTEDFTLDEIWQILSLAEQCEYRADTVGGVTYHQFDVSWGETISYGDEEVHVKAGLHRLLLDTHTSEWIEYEGP